MKAKKKNVNNSWLVVALALFAVVVLALYTSGRTKVAQVSPTNSPAPVVQEETANGVYTNYTHGFKFKYPADIFTEVSPWSRDRDFKSFSVKDQRFPVLIVDIYSKDFLGSFYRSCYSTNNLSEIKVTDITPKKGSEDYVARKLYNRDQICVSETTPKANIGEEGWSYGVTVPLNNDKIISVTLGTSSLKNHRALRSQFDKLVESFEFLEN